MNYLVELDLRGNPVQKAPKYRDQMIMLGLKLCKFKNFVDNSYLENLDDKKIMD